jgi:DNA-binding transcriptional MocR family regulator
VLFTPGEHFLAEKGARCSAMRLNFSAADAATADRGLAVLAELIAT